MNIEMNTALIYRTTLENMDILLTDDHEWRKAMTAILKYGFDGQMPERTDDPSLQSIYCVALPPMKRAREKYIQKVIEGSYQ